MCAARSIHSRGCRKRWPICPTPLLNLISTTASTPCPTGAPLGAPTRHDILLLYFGSHLREISISAQSRLRLRRCAARA